VEDVMVVVVVVVEVVRAELRMFPHLIRREGRDSMIIHE
jgi:hypothetical protein